MKTLAISWACALACAGPGAARQHDDYDRLHGQADRCPLEAEDEDGFADHDGCPDWDNDGDEILDQHDLCPNDAEDMDLFEDDDGCPDPDNDKDRIADADDACPDDAETYNGTDDDDGCPDKGKIEVAAVNCFPIADNIYFQPNSARFTALSGPILDALAASIDIKYEIDLVAVAGHAASNERDPEALAMARAEAVKKALLQRGVTPDRLKLMSGGARAQEGEDYERNRRVRFHILRYSGDDVAEWNGTKVVPIDSSK